MRFKKLLLNWKILLMLFFLFSALIAINPNPFVKGVAIKGVETGSPASLAGIENPKPKLKPRLFERIIEVNGVPINSVAQWKTVIKEFKINDSIIIKTNKKLYRLLLEKEDLGIKVAESSKSNIRLGLDLVGGTRVVLAPTKDVSREEMGDIIAILERRLNEFGISDLRISQIESEGKQLALIEIAGISEEEVKELLAKEGKFEAKIGNETVFRGGLGADISYVCRIAQCSGIDPKRPCQRIGNQWVCGFFFAVTLTPTAAQRQAEITKNLTIITENATRKLSEDLILFLDDKEVDRLAISPDLKGRAVTDVQITGSGIGISEREAMTNALAAMKRLQTILITGSLPVKLEILSLEAISPILGKGFIKNAFFVGLLILTIIFLFLLINFRNLIIALGIVFTLIVELIIILGAAALIGWNIDLAAIAGLILIIGTGVDNQIIIVGQIKEKREEALSLKLKIKKAFNVIFSAFATTAIAMIILLFSVGAVFIKGFALTTLIGITIGVLITRPAFAVILETLLR